MSVRHLVFGERPQNELSGAPGQVVADTRDRSQDAALQALVDVTRKRLALIGKQSAPPAGDRFERYLTDGVYAVILTVTVGAWAILGFVVWMPLLVRATSFFAGTVLYVSLFRDHARLAKAQIGLHFAVRFYARGFKHFLAFYRQRREPETPVGFFESLSKTTGGELFVECGWVVSIWLVTVFTVNAAVSALFGG